jgi:hypothetical protein
MKYIVLDSEGDGLWFNCTKLHVLAWTEDGINFHHTFDYDEMRKVLNEPDTKFICHNAIRHDLPVFNSILGLQLKHTKFIDSLALSWYINFDRQKHGLESYGVDYNVPKPKVTDWERLTPEEYAHRCIEDVKINWFLWKDLERRLTLLYPLEADRLRLIDYLSFKMDCAREQESNPVLLDVEKAQRHYDTLCKLSEDKVVELAKAMPKVPLYKARKPPAKPYKQDGTLSAHGTSWFALLQRLKLPETTSVEVNELVGYEEANPNSTPQVKDWLYSLGWQPMTFKFERDKISGQEKKTPQIRYPKNHEKEGQLCESVLELMDKDPAVEIMDGLTVISHRKGFFKGVLESHKEGRLIASIEGLTNTFRFKHRKPLANIPGVDKPWGKEIRECLIAPEGYVLCGSDMVSLEDNTKRHYMYPHDPDYVAEMQKQGFDPHLNLALFAGKVTQFDIDKHISKEVSLTPLRKKFKAANYSAIYGVGKAKLAREIRSNVKEADELLKAYWKRNWSIVKVSEGVEVKIFGPHMWLRNPVSGFWHNLRYDKDRFSTLNQSTGVFAFDTWLFFARRAGVVINMQFHDEEGNYVKIGNEGENSLKLKKAIELTNDKLKLNVPLDIDIKYGKNYSEVH